MTANEVIRQINTLKPSILDDDGVLVFLNELEADVAINILRLTFVPITKSSMNIPLLVQSPYNRIYFQYVASKVDLLNGDIETYSLSSEQFNADYNEYKAFVVRHKLDSPVKYVRTNYF